MRRRIGLAVAIGLGLGFGLFQLQQGFDGDAYWNAAVRLRDGLPLYQPGTAADPLVYRYPAWFAWLWVPLTYLPQGLVMAVWRLALVAAALSLVRVPQRVLVILFVPMLAAAGWQGNVQPAVVALAVWGGVWGIGIAGGIKALPLLLLAWRPTWQRVAIGLGVAAVLWATMLPYLSGYPAPRGFWPTDLALLMAITRKTPGPKAEGRVAMRLLIPALRAKANRVRPVRTLSRFCGVSRGM